MKKRIMTAVAIAAMVLPASALESRTFYDAGKAKSFEASLTGFDSKTQSVTVLNESGKTLKFPLAKLSEDCQDYVLSKKDVLEAAKNVRLKFEEVKEKKVNDTVPTGYQIEVYNRGKNSIEDISLNYTLYFDEGDLVNGGLIRKTQDGTLSTGKIYDGDTMSVDTAMVSLVRKVVAPVGGG